MKNLILAALVGGWATTVFGAELPMMLVDDLMVEEAWARVKPDGVEVYLVINNRNLTGVGPLGIEVPGATMTQVVRSDGGTFEPTLPPHAELYMQPGGVRVEVTGISVGGKVPVSVSLGEARVTFNARILGAGEPPPDHHDYDHS